MCHESSLAANASPAKAAASEYKKLNSLLLFLAFFALSLNLRAPITSLPPVIAELQEALQINAGTAGLLTSIPVLCFGF